MVNISAWLNRKPYKCIPTEIGELCIFGLTVGNSAKLHNDLGKPIAKCDPTEYTRHLCKYICFPKKSLRDDKYRPDKPVLLDADIAALTNDNLETIANIFIENNEHLNKKMIDKNVRYENGQKIISRGYGEIEYAKNEGESLQNIY
jgi:hypothetical protein